MSPATPERGEADVTELAARLAFAAYCSKVGGLNVSGQKIPAWQDLPERIRDAWRAAADAARTAR